MEIFESIKGRKKYIVTHKNADYQDVITYAKKVFKCTESHIEYTCGWIYKGLLYLENPERKGSREVGVAYWVK